VAPSSRFGVIRERDARSASSAATAPTKGTAMLKRLIAALVAALALAGTATAIAGVDEDPNSTEARNRVLNGFNY
jgi:hypothetical protein